ncbi:MAG: hypothetical protein AABZ44_01135 [Elusimicrobiota bacterium]
MSNKIARKFSVVAVFCLAGIGICVGQALNPMQLGDIFASGKKPGIIAPKLKAPAYSRPDIVVERGRAYFFIPITRADRQWSWNQGTTPKNYLEYAWGFLLKSAGREYEISFTKAKYPNDSVNKQGSLANLVGEGQMNVWVVTPRQGGDGWTQKVPIATIDGSVVVSDGRIKGIALVIDENYGGSFLSLLNKERPTAANAVAYGRVLPYKKWPETKIRYR